MAPLRSALILSLVLATHGLAWSQEPASPIQADTYTKRIKSKAVETGSLSGKLKYPDTPLPPFKVVATNLDTHELYAVEVKGKAKFSITNLPPGQYTVIAYARDGSLVIAGGFTDFVLCGMGHDCINHRLTPVVIEAGMETTNVDPFDFYSQGKLGVNPDIVSAMIQEGIAKESKRPVGTVASKRANAKK